MVPDGWPIGCAVVPTALAGICGLDGGGRLPGPRRRASPSRRAPGPARALRSLPCRALPSPLGAVRRAFASNCSSSFWRTL
eukprot:9170441-Pyramimonas_sp.AAC.1